MRRVYIIAVARALFKRRMRRFYAFALFFGISAEYISYPNVLRNIFATGSPVQSAVSALVGAPGFKLALVFAALTAGALLALDLARKDEQKYSYA